MPQVLHGAIVKYQLADGTFSKKPYPQSFGVEHLEQLATFLYGAHAVSPMRESQGLAYSICVRHDVDHNLEHAAKFASWEAERGFRSTYFVLPGSWYAAEPGAPDLLREIEAMGHEIGLHSDVVGIAYREGALHPVDGSVMPLGFCERPAEIMREQIEWLRSLGLTITGTAAHGNGIPDAPNLGLWSVYQPSDFGLDYEAYQLHKSAHYISDNRGKWSQPLSLHPEKETHVLIHPCHWAV